ncbi:5-oxoprolinase subunit B family protein [Paradevosia shaoguanensis]|uniref:Allophanate hydrolase subunit 1 n=1 Tax=Paradevosia shaoguanensis TaxID=1335043 RepID=A0AA41QM90_9HYPH|nr:allophanate hydrolase subunit 1 [Paradevosia shaoguanensis]MCF1742560.1 allophanate hydrolase subunit 1 [Paradevosia shaoguanensis]MCI0127043.1 allophanate hydrolase subunit 1 [Paradevosia shaoguanensis]
MDAPLPLPMLMPLGDRAFLVRFGTSLSEAANRAAIAFALRLDLRTPEGVEEIDPNLVSVLVRYDPARVVPGKLAGELRLLLSGTDDAQSSPPRQHRIEVHFGGEDGPDLDSVAQVLNLTPAEFVAAHNASVLRVLTTGFAPGFVYCGFHPEALHLPRRTEIHTRVPPGSVLFAAGQTAITATPIPTGWHVIGRTDFANFVPDRDPPTRLREGDEISFVRAGS